VTDQQPTPTPPANASEAQARINTLTGDKAWTDRFLSGDHAAMNEFQTLTGAVVDGGSADDVVAGVLGGKLPEFGVTTEQRMMTATVDQFRSLGIRDDVTKQFLSDRQVTPNEYELVANLKRELMSDPEYVKQYLDGNVKAKQRMTIINMVLVNGVKVESAA
jgi:hypothetical protein